jgi:hypothetical protein
MCWSPHRRRKGLMVAGFVVSNAHTIVPFTYDTFNAVLVDCLHIIIITPVCRVGMCTSP